ncbi:MAG TPA: ACT domain-containing protein [Acidobacteriota bacterium]|jgi:hypothetical protein|nr:ACT domain-containing protein [Acidobacteriota bacterium]
MAIVKQLSVKLEDKPGMLAEVCSELAKVAVNISAIMISKAPAGEAPLRVVVDNVDVAKKVFNSLKLAYTEEDVLAVHLKERPGALGRVSRKLAEKGIDVRYAYGSIEKNSDRALLILAVSDLHRGAEVLK